MTTDRLRPSNFRYRLAPCLIWKIISQDFVLVTGYWSLIWAKAPSASMMDLILHLSVSRWTRKRRAGSWSLKNIFVKVQTLGNPECAKLTKAKIPESPYLDLHLVQPFPSPSPSPLHHPLPHLSTDFFCCYYYLLAAPIHWEIVWFVATSLKSQIFHSQSQIRTLWIELQTDVSPRMTHRG